MNKTKHNINALMNITAVAVVSLTGCTIYLPPNKEPIPAADPIIIPEKATVDKSAVANKQQKKAHSGSTTDPNTTTQKKPTRQEQVFYIVKKGDTVFEVMRKTGINWQKIIDLNNLKAPEYTIHPGQSLRIK